MAARTVQKFSKTKNKRERSRLIFYVALFALPLLQFLVFYVFVNFNSIIISFQKFIPNEGELGYQTIFVGFDNFKVAFERLFSPSTGEMIIYSLIYYLCSLLIVTPLALLFSFYIAKNYRLGGFFRVILYLPSVLSGIVLAIIFNCVCRDVYPYLYEKFTGVKIDQNLLEVFGKNGEFTILVFYNMFLAFGTNTMLYTGAMTDINPSLIEASKLDGAGPVHQFFHVYVPMIWPTLVTFIVTGLAGLFIEQMSLYSLFGGGASTQALFETFGYFFYRQSTASNMYIQEGVHVMSYPELSALGILVTIFIIPVVMVVRKLLQKFGPSSK